MHNKNEAALRQPRTVLLAGCVCGVIASIAQPKAAHFVPVVFLPAGQCK